MYKLILASKSKVRREILSKYNINCMVEHSNVDEEPVKLSLLKEGATPEIISKNLARNQRCTSRISQIIPIFIIIFTCINQLIIYQFENISLF